MASSDERLKILDMIKDGKITVDEGEKLLLALSEGSRNKPLSSQPDPRVMRVRVTDTITGKTKVSVNLPMGLVDAGLNIAARFVEGMGIEDIGDAIRSGLTGKIVDVHDEDDGEHVEIFIE